MCNWFEPIKKAFVAIVFLYAISACSVDDDISNRSNPAGPSTQQNSDNTQTNTDSTSNTTTSTSPGTSPAPFVAPALIAPSVVCVRNLYVNAATGSDTNNGMADATAFKTLQKAADLVIAGDCVNVRPGTYVAFSMGWNFQQDGTADHPIVWKADPGAKVNAKNSHTADGINLEGSSYVIISGFEIIGNAGATPLRAGIRAVSKGANARGVVIENNYSHNNSSWGILTSHEDGIVVQFNKTTFSTVQHGIYISNGSVNPIVRNNISASNAGCGIHMNGDLSQGGTGLITGALVESNIVYDNSAGGGSGINADGLQTSIIRNNLLYNNHASGISFYKIDAADGAKNNLVVNNTVLNATGSRWNININSGSTGNKLYNNILYNYNTATGAISISADSLSGFESDYNIVDGNFSKDQGLTRLSLAQWSAATGQDTHSFISTPLPLFTNIGTNDYTLSATSPAIDKALASQAPAIDLKYDPRPVGAGPDIGAYERK